MSDEATSPGSLLDWVPRLRRYARALVADAADADDLVQDTLERAWSRSVLWPGVADMRAWLFSIMHNLHVDSLRRPRLRTQSLDEDGAAAAVERVAESQDEALALRDLAAALERLPAEQREVLLLVTLEDMSYADVARTLGIPVGTVMSRLSRARERLRALLADEVPQVRLKVVRS